MIELAATYYDGDSSRGREVTVHAAADGQVRIVGLEQPLVLTLQEIVISARLGNTVRSLSLPGGAKCETPDNDAADAMARLGGKESWLVAVHVLESHWRGALGAIAFVAVVALVGVRWGIPALAERVAKNVPAELAYDLGRGTLATLDRVIFSASELAPERRAELESAFSRLAGEFPDLPLRLEFRSAMPNAFALPDGTVVVTDELVALAQHDAEIISVLAHEIGHVHHRHTLRMALESSAVGLLAFVYVGDATQLAALASALPTMVANAHYSRGHETEADDFALETMQKLSIPTHHFATMLERLEQEQGGPSETPPSYLSSHPATVERVLRFRQGSAD
jgi:Zn-dependent protease with chaperone function